MIAAHHGTVGAVSLGWRHPPDYAATIHRLISSVRVLIVGDVMLDEYLWGDVRRVSPEAPVPILEHSHRTHAAGGAANVAANIAALGGIPSVAGVIGDDDEGRLVTKVLKDCSVGTSGLVVESGRPTTTKTRVMARNQQVLRIDREWASPLSDQAAEALESYIRDQMNQSGACVLSDYRKGVVSARIAQFAVRAAHAAGIPIMVDPKGSDFSKYAGCTIITPNLAEAEKTTGIEISDDIDLAATAARLTQTIGQTGAVLITRGAEGMSLWMSGNHVAHIPASDHSVFDVTGAGDTVVGMLAVALGSGISIPDAAYLANLAAGIVVGKLGAATVTVAELLHDVVSV